MEENPDTEREPEIEGEIAETSASSRVLEARYSLRELMAEVEVERRDSAFAHELVDNEEIRKMFKAVRAQKRRLIDG